MPAPRWALARETERNAPAPRRCERPLVVEAERPAFAAREVPERAPVGRAVELVRRQGRQPAREVIALGHGAAIGEFPGARAATPRGPQVAGRRRLGFPLRHRRGGREQRAHERLAPVAGLAAREPGDVALQPRHAALEDLPRKLAGEVQALEGARARLRETDRDQRVPRVRKAGGQHRRGRVLPGRAVERQPQVRVGQARERPLGLRRVQQEDRAVGISRPRTRRSRPRGRETSTFSSGGSNCAKCPP